jgi:hypothetical protein
LRAENAICLLKKRLEIQCRSAAAYLTARRISIAQREFPSGFRKNIEIEMDRRGSFRPN